MSDINLLSNLMLEDQVVCQSNCSFYCRLQETSIVMLLERFE
jgi:hypothetical protein